ncbi:MAG TPA: hypothetical protein VN806_03495 [Caulobacteraceae bacterium]|nr:hypothetical protein [Caulobacteraceae bacterium]
MPPRLLEWTCVALIGAASVVAVEHVVLLASAVRHAVATPSPAAGGGQGWERRTF